MIWRIRLSFLIVLFINLMFPEAYATTKHPVREGYLLVRRAKHHSKASIASVHSLAGATVVESFDYPSGLELVRLGKGVSAESAVSVYENDPSILYVEPDYLWQATSSVNDSHYSEQWGLNNVEQTSGKADADINGPQMWDLATGSKEFAVMTIDTGIDYRHPDLIDNLWTNENEIPGNGIDDDGNGYIDDVHGINAILNSGDPYDDNIHGTHVAGIIGAVGNNRLGISGVMQSASIIACKFLDSYGSGDTADAIKCLDYGAHLATRENNPVTIIATNNSWGGGGYSQALFDAIQEQKDLGILFMAAASNERGNNDVEDSFPANFGSSNVISVAATDSSDKLAVFSNYGRRSVHVSAPGVDILSTVPKNRYDFLSGTSMATPFVTGLAGIIKSFHPELSWIEIKNLIVSSGTPIAAGKNTTISGRRIRAFDDNGTGALSCSNQKVIARLLPRKDSVSLRLGQSLAVSFMSINCADSGGLRKAQTLTETSKAGALALSLADNGRGLDDEPGDGIYSGTWKPAQTGKFTLRFPDGSAVSANVRR